MMRRYAFDIAVAVAASLMMAPALAGENETAVLIEIPKASPRGVATNPQGAPFVTTSASDGLIGQVYDGGGWIPFVATGGRPEGLAFDAAGDLYVADSGRKAVLKITPWGEISVVASSHQDSPFISPDRIAIGPGGDIYFTDPGAGRIYRLRPYGDVSVLAEDFRDPTDIVVRTDTGDVFVADRTGTIWRISAGDARAERFATFGDKGQPSGMAIDQRGNLYVARRETGKVSVLDRDGKLIETHAVPGSDVGGITFGGTDLKTLYVAEAETAKVYKIRVPHRSQRLLWEPDKELEITDPPDGAILNRHDGEETGKGLRILVKGSSKTPGPVRVNGVSAPVTGGHFEVRLTLRERETRIVAKAADGTLDEVTLLWDRDSFPRYRFSTDDNIRFLKDIARNRDRYRSIFENPYLALWREMHRKYGTKVHFNIYYETEGFNLSQMPDKFRDEWQKNRDWIRLTFHARANDPDRPYIHSSAERIREDYRLVTGEIKRFAGGELLSPVTTVHWGETTRAAARTLREEGIRVLAGYFRVRDELPSVSYYLSRPDVLHLSGHDYWKDTSEDLIFIRHDIVVNSVELEEIEPFLERLATDPHQSEVLELMIHEQYFYPDYQAYEPDYGDRVERAIRWVTERGYKPVFFKEGFLGAGK